MLTITPFTLTNAVLNRDPMASLARGGRHVVQALDGYDERPSVTARTTDAPAGCEKAWTTYQNIDDERRTPDRGRSLMTGDLARVVDENGAETWWICCSIGWEPTRAPGDERVEHRSQVTA